jgi:hypothetical protein
VPIVQVLERRDRILLAAGRSRRNPRARRIPYSAVAPNPGTAYRRRAARPGDRRASAENLAAVETCEAEMRHLAGLNKTIGANYNASHIHEACLGEIAPEPLPAP